MKYPVRFFQKNKLFANIASILPSYIHAYPSSLILREDDLNLFDIFNDAYIEFKNIITFEDDIENILGCGYIWPTAKSTDKAKWTAIVIYILLNYENDKILNKLLSDYISSLEVNNDEIPYIQYLENAKGLPGYNDNEVSLIFEDIPFVAFGRFNEDELYWITDGYSCCEIENSILTYFKDYNNKRKVLLNIKQGWEKDKDKNRNDNYPCEDIFFDKMMNNVCKEFGKPAQNKNIENYSIIFSAPCKSHYPDLVIEDYNNELLNQIQKIYDKGEFDKAHTLWKNAYSRLEKYELQIKYDYLHVTERIESWRSVSDEEIKENGPAFADIIIFRYIENMKIICDKFHKVVEPYERLKAMEEKDEDTKSTCKLSCPQVMYLIHMSGLYGDGTTEQWGAVLHMLTGWSQHTIRQHIKNYLKPDSKLMSEKKQRKVDEEYNRILEDFKEKNRNKKKDKM